MLAFFQLTVEQTGGHLVTATCVLSVLFRMVIAYLVVGLDEFRFSRSLFFSSYLSAYNRMIVLAHVVLK